MNKSKKIIVAKAGVCIISCLLFFEISASRVLDNSEYCKKYTDAQLRGLGKNYEYSDIPNLFFVPKPHSPRFNSLGLNDVEYDIHKGENTFRIMVVGDSIVTVEDYVGQDRSNFFHEILEKELNHLNTGTHFEVWNLGVRKYNTCQEYAYFKNKFLQYKPDLVILSYAEFDDYLQPRLIYNKKYSKTKNCVLATIPKFLPIAQDGHERLATLNSYRAFNIIMYGILNKLAPAQYPPLFFKSRESLSYVKKNRDALMKFKSLGEENDFEIVVVVFPRLKEKYGRDAWLLKSLKENFRFIDLYDPFASYKGGISQLRSAKNDDVHPNQKGHEIAARAVFRYLLNIL